jgi:hypothetical protein
MTAAAIATIATVEAATSTRWLLPDSPRRKLGREPARGTMTVRLNVFLNLSEEDLRTRIVDRWDRGEGITWGGETADSSRSSIRVFR